MEIRKPEDLKENMVGRAMGFYPVFLGKNRATKGTKLRWAIGKTGVF